MTIYYVSTAGNDSNNGTSPSTPWLTISKANSGSYSAGDSLLFNGGDTFSGNLAPTISGTQTARCFIGSYGTGAATIDCGDGNGVYILDGEFVTVNYLVITGSGVSPSDGSTTNTGFGIRFHDDRASGNKFRSCYVDTCVITGTQAGIGITVPTPDTSPASVVGFADVRVQNCTIHDIQGYGITCYGGTTWLVSNFNFSAGNGVFSGVYIGYNTIYNVYGTDKVASGPTQYAANPILPMNTTGLMIERNLVHDAGFFQPSGDMGSIVCSSCADITVQCNEIYNTMHGVAIDMDLATTGHPIIQGNYTHENTGAGIWDYSSDGAIVRFNVLRNDCLTSQEPACLIAQTAGGPTQIYSNTVIGDKNLISGSGVLVQVRNDAGFYNNIFVGNNSLQIILISSGSPTFIGNLYYPGAAGALNLDGHSTLAAWRTAGYEKLDGIDYGVVADPLLSNPQGSATTLPATQVNTLTFWDLTASSPAIGAGIPPELISLYTGLSDFHGYPCRTGGPVDIGAVAYAASRLVPGIGGGSSLLSPIIGGMA